MDHRFCFFVVFIFVLPCVYLTTFISVGIFVDITFVVVRNQDICNFGFAFNLCVVVLLLRLYISHMIYTYKTNCKRTSQKKSRLVPIMKYN